MTASGRHHHETLVFAWVIDKGFRPSPE